jgi:hypothetical protein
MTLEDAGEDQIAHLQRRIERFCRAAVGVAQRLSPAPRILPCRRVAVCRLSGGSSAAAAAQNGSDSDWSERRCSIPLFRVARGVRLLGVSLVFTCGGGG